MPSNVTTPEQGSANMTQTIEKEDRSAVEDREEASTDTTRQPTSNGHNQLPELDKDLQISEAKYESIPHAAQLLKSSDLDSKRLHLSRMLKGLKPYDDNPFDSRDLKEMVTDTARRRMEETSSLLVYIDNLEMKLTHLQSQTRVWEKEGEAHRLETMKIVEDCECLFCQVHDTPFVR